MTKRNGRSVILFLALIFMGSTQTLFAERGIGGYGFLSDYRCMAPEKARQKIRTMYFHYKIKDFQFYDWFYSYSKPTHSTKWKDAFFHSREICLATIISYTDEIRKLGGRSWAYVQSVAAEEYDLADNAKDIHKLITKNGSWYIHAGRFPTYFANASWAGVMVQRFAPTIAKLGFYGIHWDSLGAIAGSYGAENKGFHAFLRRSKALLIKFNLQQTFNFVNMAWWEPGHSNQLVKFPYSEIWDLAQEIKFYSQMSRYRGSVIAMYPSVAKPDGFSESMTMKQRWIKAQRLHSRYLLLGDGDRRLVREYFPSNKILTKNEKSFFRLYSKF